MTGAINDSESPKTRESISPPAPVIQQRIPIRVRLSIWRQRIILTFRFWFRLPIDDVKEQQSETRLDAILEANEQALEATRKLLRVVSVLNARLKAYESAIPRMREVGLKFDQEQARLQQMANVPAEDLKNGILSATPNGHP